MNTNISKLQNWNINKRKINHNYDNHIESKWTLVKFIIKDIKVGNPNHLLQQFKFVTTRTIHYSQGLSLMMRFFIILM
jgi:hypothetical protein